MGACFSIFSRLHRLLRSAQVASPATATDKMTSQPPSAVTDVMLLQENLQFPPSNLGILEFLPFEIRLMIYEEYFRSSKPSLDVNVGYEAETGQVVTSKITRRGNELLLAGINIWREGFNLYWRHVTTVTASRTLLQPPEPIPSSSGNTSTAPTEPLPVHLGCLVQVLPRIAKDSILHLRNIEFPTVPGVDPMALGPFALRGPKATALLTQFLKLKTVMFNEYREGIEYNPQWNLRSRHTIMQHDIYNDFLLHPTMHTPQRWLHDRYGLDVVNDPAVNKIRFLKKAIEKRRSWWEFFPGNAPGGGDTDQDLLHPLASPPPLADAFLDFTIGKSYARPPGLPDEEGYELVMSWVEPKEQVTEDISQDMDQDLNSDPSEE